MAERTGFPQIPRPVWYGVRQLFGKSLGRKLDENSLAASLDVQPAAARQYLLELRRVGLITEEGTPTELAKKWRLDETYDEAIEEILKEAYPDTLVDLAPAGAADRATVERWFKNHGLGEGTARNKAATYLMIANGGPTFETAAKGAAEPAKKPRNRKSVSESPREGGNGGAHGQQKNGHCGSPSGVGQGGSFPLNVNVQIHISADASTDQIDAIFSAMRKYLGGDAAS